MPLTPTQKAFASCKDPFPCFCGGFGSGKTAAAIARAMALKCHFKQHDVAYYLPTYGLVEDIAFRRFPELCEKKNWKYELNKTGKTIEFGNSGRIIFRTMDDPSKIVGYEVAHSIVDELDTLQMEKAHDVWNKIIARNRQKCGMQNTVAVATTPEGYRFVYDRWVRKKADGYVLFRAKTEENRENLPPDYIKNLRDSYPSYIADAYLNGEFVDMNAALFQRSWIKTGSPPALLPRTMAVDLAISTKEGADYTAIVIMCRDSQGNVYIEHVERFQQAFNSVIERIKSVAAIWKPSIIAIEQVQYQAAVVQELTRLTKLPIRGVRPDRDKLSRFQPLMSRYEQGLVYHSDTLQRDFEDELASFPSGKNDDMVDAASLAFQSLPDLKPRTWGIMNRTF